MIKKRDLYVCDPGYIFSNYYKFFKKESYIKTYDLIDDYGDDNNDDVHVDEKNMDNIIDVELKVKNTPYKQSKQHVLSSHY